MEWINLAVQAGGAIAVCAMFLWYLTKKQGADDSARREFLDHLTQKDIATGKAIDQQIEYLRHRDEQSKDIADKGFASLNDLAREFSELRGAIHDKCCSKG